MHFVTSWIVRLSRNPHWSCLSDHRIVRLPTWTAFNGRLNSADARSQAARAEVPAHLHLTGDLPLRSESGADGRANGDLMHGRRRRAAPSFPDAC